MRLKNKVAVVTGGGAGIGEAIATVSRKKEPESSSPKCPRSGRSTVEAIQGLEVRPCLSKRMFLLNPR